MTDPTGAPETVRAPKDVAAAKRPFWLRRPWQIAGGAVLLAVALVVFMVWSLPLGRALEPLPNPTLILVTADGKPFARRGSYKEQPVDVTKLPKHVPGAFVAIEDRRFYSHIGIDFRAIARALQRNVGEGEVQQGGSTITQQLAKNAFLSSQRSLRRKAQEALIAVGLEGFEDRSVGSLSSGQFQRVLFARMLVQDAQFLLLDEPFNDIDAKTTQDLLGVLQGCLARGKAVVAVLHDVAQVQDYFPRTVLIAREKIAEGPTHEVMQPEWLRKASHKMNHWQQDGSWCAVD